MNVITAEFPFKFVWLIKLQIFTFPANLINYSPLEKIFIVVSYIKLKVFKYTKNQT